MSVADQISALRTNLSNAYDAIETAGGTVPQNKNAANLATAVATISGGGSANNNWSEVMSGQSSALYDNDITALRDSALNRGNLNIGYLTSVSFPNVTTAGQAALQGQTALTQASMPSLTTLPKNLFTRCSQLATVDLPFSSYTGIPDTVFSVCALTAVPPMPLVRSIGIQSFYECDMPKIDIGTNSSSTRLYLGQNAFGNCSSLLALIIRYSAVATWGSTTSPLTGSSIASGTGYIYVPSALVDSYKSDSNWSTYSSQFRAIEDYSDDGTVNGDIILS